MPLPYAALLILVAPAALLGVDPTLEDAAPIAPGRGTTGQGVLDVVALPYALWHQSPRLFSRGGTVPVFVPARL